jgi:hypothetical protein
MSKCTSPALAIVAEHSFWLSGQFPSNVHQAAICYMESPVAKNVSREIQIHFATKIPTILAIMDATAMKQYKAEIATPLTDVVINNLLRTSTVRSS